MKNIKLVSQISIYATGITVLIAVCWLAACRPDSPASLGPKPKPDFTIVTSAGDPNNVVLVNKSSIASIPYWIVADSNGSSKFSGDSVKLNFPFSGAYSRNVTLLAVGNGGIDSVTKAVTITISQNDTSACKGTTLQGFLASCTQKTWQLAPVGYAEMVGPKEGDGSWWGNGAAEPAGLRLCDFNDSYTFVFNAAGTFNFDNKGDFFADDYLGNGKGDCETNDKLPAAQKPWASGSFRYTVNSSGGSAGLGQLTVKGLGAHIGIAKVQGGGLNDNTTGPVAQSITYNILAKGHNATGNYDSLILSTKTSYGAWTYQLRSN